MPFCWWDNSGPIMHAVSKDNCVHLDKPALNQADRDPLNPKITVPVKCI